jgi:hypothetical protein
MNMNNENERMRILEMIENGEITLEEGTRRLEGLPFSPEEESDTRINRMQILDMINKGEISPEEGIIQLGTVEESTGNKDYTDDETTINEEPIRGRLSDEDMNRWKRWWMVPLWVGIGITSLAGLWMNSIIQSSGFNFWFYCSWVPLLLGVTLIAIAWGSRTSTWIHVRVTQPKGQSPRRIAISFPIPLRLTAWAIRNFGHYSSSIDKTAVDEILLALEQQTQNGDPLFVDVSEGENGERVQVYIG